MSGSTIDFVSPEECALANRFLTDGYVIIPAEDRESLDWIRDRLVAFASEQLNLVVNEDPREFLNSLHNRLSSDDLNKFRLAVIAALNAETELRARNYSLARQALQTLVGNELCMQRRINLSIQMPRDESSVLPIHGDVLNGDSPFEVVHWTPFVDVYGTKSMFILPPEKSAETVGHIAKFKGQGNDALMRAVKADLVWLEIPYGETLLFNQNLLHGNIVNVEGETRWSTNCRFKGVFTPYADKKLGEFFEPITLRAASRMGLDYRPPSGFRTSS